MAICYTGCPIGRTVSLPVSLSYILILSSNLRLSLYAFFFFKQACLFKFQKYPILTKCSSIVNLIDSNTRSRLYLAYSTKNIIPHCEAFFISHSHPSWVRILFSNTFSLYSFLDVRDCISHNMWGNVIVLCILLVVVAQSVADTQWYRVRSPAERIGAIPSIMKNLNSSGNLALESQQWLGD